MQHVHQLDLPFKLDQLTEGQGNCFPIAVVQQCRRPDILQTLTPNIQQIVKNENGHSQLRVEVVKFISSSEHRKIRSFKEEYVNNVAIAEGRTWEEYWNTMIQDKTEVDYMFIQATSWYLELDMMIIDTSCTEDNPYIIISGNLENDTRACKEMITMGSKSNSHYQSILEVEGEVTEPSLVSNEQTQVAISQKKDHN